MKNVAAIFEKEMKSYFVSPIAYVCYRFSGHLRYFLQHSYHLHGTLHVCCDAVTAVGNLALIDVPALVSRNFFGVLSTVILFMLPMITMATFADEKRRVRWSC
jgi:ABC-2 type transport system permease protein